MLLIAVVGTTVAVATSEETIAKWMTPARMRPQTRHWFQVSVGESHVAVCESKPGETSIPLQDSDVVTPRDGPSGAILPTP